MIFSQNHILLNTNFETKEQLFKHLALLAQKYDLTDEPDKISQGFIARENEGTTGFEDGFAIPHARIKAVKKASLFVISNKNKFKNWESLDHNGVQFVLALLVPDGANNLHIDILASLATKLMNEQFRNNIKTGNQKLIFDSLQQLITNLQAENSQNIVKENNELKAKPTNKFLIGISACPGGIAHTFMAKEKIEQAAQELNYRIKWETQGANGKQNALTENDITKADLIIIASDIDLDLSRFNEHKILITNTNEVIKDGKRAILRAEKDSKIFKGKLNEHQNFVITFFKLLSRSFQSTFNNPWKYLGFSASLIAIISLIGFATYGNDWSTEGFTLNQALFQVQEISKFSLYLALPLMVGQIAYKATNSKEAGALTLIGCLLLNMPTFMVNWNSLNHQEQEMINIFYNWNNHFSSSILNHGSNIIGALVITVVVVLIYKGLIKWENWLKKNKSKKGFNILINFNWPWLNVLIPCGFILFGVVFLLGAPLAFISSYLTYALIDYPQQYWWLRFLIGGFFGLLIAFDLGGIINKVGLITLIGLAQYDLRFASIIAIGIPVASIGCGTTYAFFKKRFNNEDAKDVAQSFSKGLKGMTEGPLHLTNKYGLRVGICNLTSTFIATGLALVLGIYIFKGGLSGILFFGAQASLATINDLAFLNVLLPQGQGIITVLCSLGYGIIGYYLIMVIGTFSYALLASITFAWPGKNQIFKTKAKSSQGNNNGSKKVAS